MTTGRLPSLMLATACASLLVLPLAAQAQTARTGRIKVVPQPRLQALPPGVAAFGLPQPGGLPSPSPFPAGLPSPMTHPGGLPSNLPVNFSALRTPGDRFIAPPHPPVVVLSAGALVCPPCAATPPGPWSAVDLASSFIGADANRDGELTRAEALRLTIQPYAFEEMDRNYDGVISRFEYENATR